LTIIGNGNVAFDIVRVLSKNRAQLEKTDINDEALNEIVKNTIENIIIVGRRGVIQSAFALKELRELTGMKNLEFYVLE